MTKQPNSVLMGDDPDVTLFVAKVCLIFGPLVRVRFEFLSKF